MVKAHDEIWVGTSHSGIIVLNHHGEELERIEIPSYDHSTSGISYTVEAMADADNKVWIGTYSGGKFYYDLEQKVLIKPASLSSAPYEYMSNVYDLHLDEEGILWAGTDDGLILFDTNTMTLYHQYVNDPNYFESLVNNRVRVIYQDYGGLYWIGNKYGGMHNVKRNYPFISINDGLQ